MRYFFVLICLLLFSATFTTMVQACGGGGQFTIQYLEHSDYDSIVHGTVLEVDNRGYNAIIEIDRSFKGENAQYLTIMRYPAALEVTSAVRDYDTSCLYSGSGEEWVIGNRGYFVLSNKGNGTFTGFPHYVIRDGMVKYYSFDIHKDMEVQEFLVTTEEFEQILLEYSDREVAIAPISTPYPLMRFLYITTESGEQYQLNPDRSLTLLAPETTPVSISNDGSHVVFRLSENQLGFQYLSLSPKPLREDITADGGWILPQDGRSALFSPDSNFVAVNEESHLTVYMFDNYERGGYGQRMRMQNIGSAPVIWRADEVPPTLWSADSTTLAFQDEQGIWVWDIFEMAEPELILDNAENGRLLGLSSSGRYIRYGGSELWKLLDRDNGEVYDNALSTPDERNLIFLRDQYPEGTPDINRRGDRVCRAPLMKTCPLYIQWNSSFEFFWYKHNQFALLGCFEDRCYVFSHHWQLSIGSNDLNLETQLDTPLPLISAFAYDPAYDQPVVAVDDYRLEFDFYANYERDESGDSPLYVDIVDLSDQLDSPIVDLEWGQPIFFELGR